MQTRPMRVSPKDLGIPEEIGGLKVKGIDWKDFSAKPPPPGECWFLAMTFWNVSYSIVTTKRGETVTKTVTATSALNNKCWTIDNENYNLLRHQYGHYLITVLSCLQFMKRMNHSLARPQDKQFEQWAKQQFKKVLKEYNAKQREYDEQTNHYLNRDQQNLWEKKIAALMLQYHQFFKSKRINQPPSQSLSQLKKQSDLKQPLKNKQLQARNLTVPKQPLKFPVLQRVQKQKNVKIGFQQALATNQKLTRQLRQFQ